MRSRMLILAVVIGLGPTQHAVAQCSGDTDSDNVVGINDFLAVLGAWGDCPPEPDPCLEDVDGDGTVGINDFLLVLANWGPCPPFKSPAIVVYNENYPDLDGDNVGDARQIAEYYAQQRGLHPASLCGVQLPTGDHAIPDELLAARKEILEHCICRLIAEEVQSETGCNLDNPGALDAIRDASPVAHIVLIKGIPVRLFDSGLSGENMSDQRGPSFGFYLSYLLANDVDVFGGASVGVVPYTQLDAIHGSLPPLSPGEHRIFARGRIEAIDTPRTLALIDRTLDAERAGVRGNIFIERSDPTPGGVNPYLFNLMSSHDPACFAGPWDPALCRIGATHTVEIPGTDGSNVPNPLDASFLYGNSVLDEFDNPFSAFAGFSRMLNWHKTDLDCDELCDELPIALQEQCRQDSADYFGDINSDCVGGALGFMAYQVRSWPVQYYGFVPPGWLMAKQSSQLKSMPVILAGDAYDVGVFAGDDRYAHYGVYDHLNPDDSTCTVDGSSVPCPAHLALNLACQFDIDDVVVSRGTEHTLRFRYRYEGPDQPMIQLALRYIPVVGNAFSSPVQTVTLSGSGGGWNTIEQVLSPSAQGLGATVTRIRVRLWSTDTEGIQLGLVEPTVRGFLDLDGFELIDGDTAANVFPLQRGSFVLASKQTTDQGDWPANVIDRFGGIASWGNGSHHGGGTGSGDISPSALFSGRTLGESITHAGGFEGGASTQIYGDPLYRPAAVKIRATSFVDVYQGDRIGDPAGYDVWFDTAPMLNLAIDVLHGTINQDTTEWEVSTCTALGVAECDGQWSPVLQGQGAGNGFDLGTFDQYLDNINLGQSLTMRLRIWNAGDQDNDLTNYAFFNYLAHDVPDCVDVTGDGVVDQDDVDALLPSICPPTFCYRGCDIVNGFCVADINQDGLVNITDWLAVLGALGTTCQGCPQDVDGDGIVGELDFDIVTLYLDSCPVEGGFCIADFNRDGLVDGLDLDVVFAELGCVSGCFADLSGDDDVDQEDVDLMFQYLGTCPIVDGFCMFDFNQDGFVNNGDLGAATDVNGDGVVTVFEFDLIFRFTSCPMPCPTPYEDCPIDAETGFCIYDLDQDGDVDGFDYQIVLDNFGPCPLAGPPSGGRTPGN